MKIEEILALTQEVAEFKPIIAGFIEGLKVYEDEWRALSDFIVNETVQTRSRIFTGFVDKGLTREEALALTVAAVKDFQNVASKAKIKNKA